MASTPYKQVLLYRRDLNMRKGKIAAQCAHASLAVFLHGRLQVEAVSVLRRGHDQSDVLDARSTLVIGLDDAMARWLQGGSAKIVLSVETEEDLVRAHDLARLAGLPTALIRDAGHTEFGGVPTLTACAIGPGLVEAIDGITGPDGQIQTKLA